MTTYYKAVRPDGTDFFSGQVQWVPETGIPDSGHLVKHPWSKKVVADSPAYFLSASRGVGMLPGVSWPCRLLRVQPAGEPVRQVITPHVRGSVAWRVVKELPAWQVFGPQGQHVVALIEKINTLTDVRAVDAALSDFNLPRIVSERRRSRRLATDATLPVLWCFPAAFLVARHTIQGLIDRDLITDEEYDQLTIRWREVVGPIHPDDPDLG